MVVAHTLFLLLAAHALCDYPLQGDFLARGKNHKSPIPGVPWFQCLAAHALIHGGAVALVVGGDLGVLLGMWETLIHAGIDYAKCDGWFSFSTDQAFHVGFKILWAVLAVLACQ